MTDTTERLHGLMGMIAADFTALRMAVEAADAAPTVLSDGRNHMLAMGCMAGAATATSFARRVEEASADEVHHRLRKFYASLAWAETTVRETLGGPLPKGDAIPAIAAYMTDTTVPQSARVH